MQLSRMLQHRVDIEDFVSTQSPVTGAIVKEWAVVKGNVPCGIFPMSGREFIAASGRDNETNTRLLFADDPTFEMLPRFRVVHRYGGRTVIYSLRSAPLPDPKLRWHFNVMATTGPLQE